MGVEEEAKHLREIQIKRLKFMDETVRQLQEFQDDEGASISGTIFFHFLMILAAKEGEGKQKELICLTINQLEKCLESLDNRQKGTE